MRTEILYSAKDLTESGVDAFAFDPAHTSGYLRAVEDSGVGGRDPRHILVLNGHEPIAFMPCYIQHSSYFDDLNKTLVGPRTERIANMAKKMDLFPQLSPVLLACSPESFYCRLMICPDAGSQEKRSILQAILVGMDELTKEEDVDVTGFLNLPSREKLMSDMLLKDGYLHSNRTASAYLPIRWRDYNSYIHSFRRNARKGFKSERRKATRNRLLIEKISDLSSNAQTLSGIIHEMWEARGRDCPFNSEYYRLVAEHMQEKAIVLAASIDGQILGFTLLLETDHEMFAYQYGGLPNDLVRDSNLYFNLCYSSTIERAISRGHKMIRYGPASFHVKLARGCLLENLGVFLRCTRRRHLPALKALMFQNRRKRRSLLAENLQLTWASLGMSRKTSGARSSSP